MQCYKVAALFTLSSALYIQKSQLAIPGLDSLATDPVDNHWDTYSETVIVQDGDNHDHTHKFKNGTHISQSVVDGLSEDDDLKGPDQFGECKGRLRCIKVLALPADYCFRTMQVNWCADYIGQPACIMALNYMTYVDWADNNEDSGFYQAGRSSLDVSCSGDRGKDTRGSSTFPVNSVNWSPSCKDTTEAGRCDKWNGGGTTKCPQCDADGNYVTTVAAEGESGSSLGVGLHANKKGHQGLHQGLHHGLHAKNHTGKKRI